MNRKIANRVLIGLFVCMAISLALPIFKGYWPGELVSGSFTVRGYEIVSIAPVFGSGVLLMIFISFVTLTTHIGFRKKCIILFPVNFANMILYIASTYHTRRWIYSTDAINVSEMYGAYIFCSLITLALILPFVIEQWSRPIKTYSDAEELCETMVDLGSELDGNDELGYGLFVDMLFWANEYTRLITMKAQPDIQTNKKLYEESGAIERIEADIYNNTKIAPTIIIDIYGIPNNVENNLPQVTKQLAAYTVKNTRINTAERVIITFLLSRNLFEKNSGKVMELFALILYLRSLFETISQFKYVPIARPIAVHAASASPHQ